jgi:histidine triad (HIT) family protein
MACIFCDIIQHKLPADVVYENETTLAFLDIRPLFPGHVLIVPKTHYETIWDIPDQLLTDVMSSAKLLSVAVKSATLADGIFMANNNIVSQSVPHFHIHIIPRKKKDGLKGFFWPRMPYPSDAHKADMKDKIIAALHQVDPG